MDSADEAAAAIRVLDPAKYFHVALMRNKNMGLTFIFHGDFGATLNALGIGIQELALVGCFPRGGAGSAEFSTEVFCNSHMFFPWFRCYLHPYVLNITTCFEKDTPF